MTLDKMMDTLRASLAMPLVADLGVVHSGRMGHADCSVSASISASQGLCFVNITVEHRKGRGSRVVRVITWPFSETAPTDLGRILADLQALEGAVRPGALPDTRGWLARCLDRLLRVEHLGDYRFASPRRDDAEPLCVVKASVSRSGGQADVTLTVARPGGEPILAQFPLAACGAIGAALIRYRGSAAGP